MMKAISQIQLAAILLVVTLATVGVPRSIEAQTGPLCPAAGADTGCGAIIIISDAGASVTFTGQPPYDGYEDTLVGVFNASSLPISSLGLASS